MVDNNPNPSLRDLVQKGRLGYVDAFLSHSWHDNGDLKWESLQAWRCQFRAAHRREPRLWIDKFCIDQNRIEDSLACLPVYLAGCETVLVLYGPSYLRRL